MHEGLQLALVGLLVTLAALYLAHRLTGLPRLGPRRRAPEAPVAPVQLGARLARGLRKAEADDDRCHG